MREIKFRAWDNARQIMHDKYANIGAYGELYVSQFHGSQFDGSALCPDLILMQYTGVTDCNGTDIYEGDIIEWFDSDSERRLDQIIFYNGAFRMCNMTMTLADYALKQRGSNTHVHLTVIGNIYEDHKLLNKK